MAGILPQIPSYTGLPRGDVIKLIAGFNFKRYIEEGKKGTYIYFRKLSDFDLIKVSADIDHYLDFYAIYLFDKKTEDLKKVFDFIPYKLHKDVHFFLRPMSKLWARYSNMKMPPEFVIVDDKERKKVANEIITSLGKKQKVLTEKPRRIGTIPIDESTNKDFYKRHIKLPDRIRLEFLYRYRERTLYQRKKLNNGDIGVILNDLADLKSTWLDVIHGDTKSVQKINAFLSTHYPNTNIGTFVESLWRTKDDFAEISKLVGNRREVRLKAKTISAKAFFEEKQPEYEDAPILRDEKIKPVADWEMREISITPSQSPIPSTSSDPSIIAGSPEPLDEYVEDDEETEEEDSDFSSGDDEFYYPTKLTERQKAKISYTPSPTPPSLQSPLYDKPDESVQPIEPIRSPTPLLSPIATPIAAQQPIDPTRPPTPFEVPIATPIATQQPTEPTWAIGKTPYRIGTPIVTQQQTATATTSTQPERGVYVPQFSGKKKKGKKPLTLEQLAKRKRKLAKKKKAQKRNEWLADMARWDFDKPRQLPKPPIKAATPPPPSIHSGPIRTRKGLSKGVSPTFTPSPTPLGIGGMGNIPMDVYGRGNFPIDVHEESDTKTPQSTPTPHLSPVVLPYSADLFQPTGDEDILFSDSSPFETLSLIHISEPTRPY